MDLSAARQTIPATWYTDPAFLERESTAIFFKDWLFVGHICEFSQPGAYVTRTILNQNIFVMRGDDGNLRGFYNVCLHRAHELLAGNGVAKTIVCPYHNWSYRTDGRLRVANNARNVAGFDKDRFCLKQVQVEICGHFVFVNLDLQAKPLAQSVGELAAQISAEYPDIAAPELKLIDISTWDVQANWKVDVENFLECYHCAPVHTDFCNVFEVLSQRATIYDRYIYHYANPKPVQKAAYSYDPNIFPKRLATWTLFPNTMIYIFPGEPSIGVMVASPHPTDPNRSLFWAKTYAPNEKTAMLPTLVEVMEKTMQEDFAVIESVQRGLHSHGFDQGTLLIDDTLSEKSEHTVYHFQQYIRAALA